MERGCGRYGFGEVKVWQGAKYLRRWMEPRTDESGPRCGLAGAVGEPGPPSPVIGRPPKPDKTARASSRRRGPWARAWPMGSDPCRRVSRHLRGGCAAHRDSAGQPHSEVSHSGDVSTVGFLRRSISRGPWRNPRSRDGPLRRCTQTPPKPRRSSRKRATRRTPPPGKRGATPRSGRSLLD
jgi:hypothetical protein